MGKVHRKSLCKHVTAGMCSSFKLLAVKLKRFCSAICRSCKRNQRIMAQRKLQIVVSFLLFVIEFASSTQRRPVVVVDPEWINYAQTATLTATFDPPCPGVSIFKRGMDAGYADTCIYGPKCPVDHARPVQTDASAHPDGYWVRFTGVNAAANGFYYATCPTTNDTYEGQVAIGVKPRIMAVEIGHPEFGVRVNLTRWQAGRQVPWNSPFDDPNKETTFKAPYPVPVSQGSTYITITVGMGVDPHMEAPQATSPKLFKFEAPDFDDEVNMKREQLENFKVLEDYPVVTQFRYRMDRKWLANEDKCGVSSRVLAQLNNRQFDVANILIELQYEPTVANVTASVIKPNEESPVGHSCDCLFECHVGSCPGKAYEQLYDYEWSFPDLNKVSDKYDTSIGNTYLAQRLQQENLRPNISSVNLDFVRGNVVGYPSYFLLNSSACQELFLMSRDWLRTQQPLTFTCRVAKGVMPASQQQINFYDFMGKLKKIELKFYIYFFFLANVFPDECKYFRRPESTGHSRTD